MNWSEFDKYKVAIDYIIENRPKHIVEYGSGESTIIINKLLEELDYGGKLTSYEDNLFFYEKHNELGWNKNNCIKLVDIEVIDNIKGIVRYVHPLEEIKDVDFIILDGPDYKRFRDVYDNPSNITDNIKVIYDNLKTDIPFWIDGRSGCQRFYSELEYKNKIGGYELL